MKRFSSLQTLVGAAILAVLLAACGGGGGGGSALPATSTAAPTLAPTATPTPVANVSGTVVDEAANTPLAGVQISLASWVVGASPAPVATTNASGVFSFSTAPGSYLLIVGSNSPTDTRATLHQGVILTAGSNTLTAPVPSPAPQVTYAPSQSAGSLRLMALSSVQQDCVTGENTGRASLALPLVVPDEFLEEDVIATTTEEIAQNTDTPTPLFSTAQPLGVTSGGTTEGNGAAGFNPCDSWTGPAYSYIASNPPYPFATNAKNVWFGATISTAANANFGAQNWQVNSQGTGTTGMIRSSP